MPTWEVRNSQSLKTFVNSINSINSIEFLPFLPSSKQRKPKVSKYILNLCIKACTQSQDVKVSWYSQKHDTLVFASFLSSQPQNDSLSAGVSCDDFHLRCILHFHPQHPGCQVRNQAAKSTRQVLRNKGTTERVATGKGHVMQECGPLDARQEVVNDLLRVTWKKHQRFNFFPSPRVFYKIRESPLSSS